MPYFDFKCPECEHFEENVQLKITNTDEEQKCPKCQTTMKKLISLCNFDMPAWDVSGCKKA
ncbi:MAG: hypothetical protein KAS32_06340 [Candidatus Peribacteraceae bacterium]|nr:hypothetical protein [Candidatus Peribacteraceae bacterium]